ncbi:MAG: contractile injection system tape measure protein [Pseudomonadota bacterium]|uniref:contractile injection system tape measure protein n=1 Tax=Burkholderiaceae TaxID=119060 RepID=UPI0010F96886|nr:contractile injection system tape measure protein [Burkholderia sp. 4M9327F10]
MTRPPLVNRVVLEPLLKRRDDGERIAGRLSRFARERLPALLHDALSGFGEDTVERILDRFEIDLGDAPPDRLEQVLEERLAKVLRDRLIDRFGFPAGAFDRTGVRAQGESGGTVPYVGNANLEALAGWLEGRVQLDARAVNRLFTDTLAVSAHDVALLLREHGRSELRRERLVMTLEAPVRVRVVRALRPTDAQQVIGDIDRFSEHHRAAPVSAMTQQAFDAVLWQTVFAYLLADRGSRFNRRMFLGSLLTKLAAHAGVAFTDLLDSLLARVADNHHAVERDESLREVLESLRRTAIPPELADGSASEARPLPGGSRLADGAGDTGTVPPGSAEKRDLEALDFYLEQGAWPWFAAHAAEPAALVLHLARHAPLGLSMVLRRRDSAAGQETRLMRLAATLDTPQRDQLIGALEPAAHRAMVAVLAALDTLIESAGFSAAQRRSLRSGLNAATLERISAVRGGAFDEPAWLARILSSAARAAGLEPGALGAALLLATHGDLARKRRVRWMRSRLVEAGAGGGREPGDDAQMTGHIEQGVLAVSTESSSSSGLDGNRLLRAFLLAWPTLVRALRFPPRLLEAVRVQAFLGDLAVSPPAAPANLPLDAVPAGLSSESAQDSLRQALRQVLKRTWTSETLFTALNRLALLSGIPLRRWLAALATAQEWREADTRLKMLRSWRAHPSRQSPAEIVIAPAPLRHVSPPLPLPTAGAAFVHVFTTGASSPNILHGFPGSSDAWLSAVLRDDFAEVAAALRARSPDERMFQRLARHLRPASLERLAAALEPKLSALSLGLLRASRVFAATARGGAGVAALEHAVLAVLLAPASARSSERVYVDRVLDGLARRLSMKPEDLADELADAAVEHSPVLHGLLKARSLGARAGHDAVAQAKRSDTQPHWAQAKSSRGAREQPVYADAWRQFAMFMRYGERPREPGASIEAAIAQLAHAAPQLLARALRENATAEPTCTWLASLDASTFAQLAQAWAPRRASTLLALQSVVAGFATRDAAFMTSSAQAAWLHHASRGSVRAMLAVLVEDTLHSAGRAAHTVLARWRRAVRLAGVAPALGREWLAWLAARETLLDLEAVAARRVTGTPTGALAVTASSRSGVEAEMSGTPRAMPRSTMSASFNPGNDNGLESADSAAAHGRSRQSVGHENQPIYVANAGMVLLWPFLHRYYELLGLVRENAFIDFDSRSRAVYLLHSLASGRTAYHEAELPLAKVMCGIAPSTLLAAASEGEPDAREQAVSEELLGGVRQNWDKLRNTTTEGLRESFLMRNGRLVRDESGTGRNWTLIVEAKAYDVLLDTLPWRISTIQLSWMTGMLAVQWRR